MRYNYTASGQKIEDIPENEELLKERKRRYAGPSGGGLNEFAPHIKRKRDKNRAKNRVARQSRRKNR